MIGVTWGDSPLSFIWKQLKQLAMAASVVDEPLTTNEVARQRELAYHSIEEGMEETARERGLSIGEPVCDRKFVQVADVRVFGKILDGVKTVICRACGWMSRENIDCPACGTPRWCEMGAS